MGLVLLLPLITCSGGECIGAFELAFIPTHRTWKEQVLMFILGDAVPVTLGALAQVLSEVCALQQDSKAVRTSQHGTSLNARLDQDHKHLFYHVFLYGSTLIEVICVSEIYWSSVWSPLVGCPLPNEISGRSKSKIILAWQNSSFLFPLAVNYQTLTSIKCACAGRKNPTPLCFLFLFSFFFQMITLKKHILGYSLEWSCQQTLIKQAQLPSGAGPLTVVWCLYSY